MARYHIAIERPEEIIPRLGKQELHWKEGRSAFELSNAWMSAKGFPASVKAVIEQAPEWRNAELLDGIFERETPLPGRGKASQTDLLAVVRLKQGNGLIGVEGKVDEPFGPSIAEWLGQAKDGNRADRLAGLCSALNIDTADAGPLAYQLLHRTCAVIFDAQQFRYRDAIMLVHSFDHSNPGNPAGFSRFNEFARILGLALKSPQSISDAKSYGGVNLRLAWVSDDLAKNRPH